MFTGKDENSESRYEMLGRFNGLDFWDLNDSVDSVNCNSRMQWISEFGVIEVNALSGSDVMD